MEWRDGAVVEGGVDERRRLEEGFEGLHRRSVMVSGKNDCCLYEVLQERRW